VYFLLLFIYLFRSEKYGVPRVKGLNNLLYYLHMTRSETTVLVIICRLIDSNQFIHVDHQYASNVTMKLLLNLGLLKYYANLPVAR
jgi:hypothetical protein